MDKVKEKLMAAQNKMLNAHRLGDEIEYRKAFLGTLEAAYASGDLVTREELKAAVEAERDACADLVSPDGEEPSVDPSNHGDIQAHESWLTGKYLADAIRARGETNDQ